MQDQNTTTHTAPLRLIRMPEVQRLTGLGRTTIYKLIDAGSFPRQRKVTPTVVVWPEHEVAAWIARVLDGHTGGEQRAA